MSTIAWDAQPGFSAARPSLRLTRRGRTVLSALAALVALGAVLSAQSAVADDPRSAIPVATHTVAAGETLWEIAGSVAAPGQDIRDVVDDVMGLNGLSTSGLQAGQQLLVPIP